MRHIYTVQNYIYVNGARTGPYIYHIWIVLKHIYGSSVEARLIYVLNIYCVESYI